MTEPASIGVKDAVNAVVQSLPDNVSWDEVHYRLYVRQQIDAGMADSEAGRLIDTDEMRRRLDAKRNQGSSR
jgi:predicted transcriptional regulator